MGAAGRVLVVDDDPTIGDVVRRYFEAAGFAVTLVGDGASALAEVERDRPDAILLDLMLPGMGGLAICREVRRRADDIPLIMVTALGEESDRVLGLELGADDYVTKPFSPRELVLRTQAVLRRTRTPQTPKGGPIADGDLALDPSRRVAELRGAPLTLTLREFDLLEFLLRHPGQALRRGDLLEEVWGWSFGDQSTVTVHVRRLREKIEDDPARPRRIVTVWGVGYRYEPVDG